MIIKMHYICSKINIIKIKLEKNKHFRCRIVLTKINNIFSRPGVEVSFYDIKVGIEMSHYFLRKLIYIIPVGNNV